MTSIALSLLVPGALLLVPGALLLEPALPFSGGDALRRGEKLRRADDMPLLTVSDRSLGNRLTPRGSSGDPAPLLPKW